MQTRTFGGGGWRDVAGFRRFGFRGAGLGVEKRGAWEGFGFGFGGLGFRGRSVCRQGSERIMSGTSAPTQGRKASWPQKHPDPAMRPVEKR